MISLFIPQQDFNVVFDTDTIVCEGAELQFNNYSDSHFNDFYWQFGDGEFSNLKSPSHTYETPGSYTVSLVGTGQICKDTMSKKIIVDSILEVSFFNDKDSICVGEHINFYHSMNSKTISHLNWDFGDKTRINNISNNHIQHAYDHSGDKHVNLQAQFRSCPDNNHTKTVHVFDLPHVDLGRDIGLCLNGKPVILKNMYPLKNMNYRYLWSTGHTTESIEVKHHGIYSLTVIHAWLGCSNTETINIYKDCYLDIPNAFTPNEDGINDHFFPRQLLSKNITKFKMQIFNRWGQIIFETTNINGRGWDGKFNNKNQPEGIYIFVIDVEIEGNKIEEYKGNVTLIR